MMSNSVVLELITLKQLIEESIRDIVHVFGNIIQSSKNVTIEAHTVINTYYAYVRPVENGYKLKFCSDNTSFRSDGEKIAIQTK